MSGCGLDCKKDKTSGIKVELVDENPFHLTGSFPGPEGSPYEGGTFQVVRTHTHPFVRYFWNILR
jgi:ubiquitin-conjugating enzyme (huntingtin interacting protein 2)